MAQPFKSYHADYVFRKMARLDPVDRDRYGRTVAWVYADGKNLCEELVLAGSAWHYKKYSFDQSLADLEIQARRNSAGLWSDPHAVAPWVYRQRSKRAARSLR